jgi:hypothetical protein
MEKEKQQSVVEFLLEKYKSQNTLLFAEDWQQAKEMEKEQIVTAHYQGYRNDIGTTEVSEQYYNKNFKSE